MQVRIKKQNVCQVVRGQDVTSGDSYYKVFSKSHHPYVLTPVEDEYLDYFGDCIQWESEIENVFAVCQFVSSGSYRVRKQTVCKVVRGKHTITGDYFFKVFQEGSKPLVFCIEDVNFIVFIEQFIKWIPKKQEFFNICEFVSVVE